MKGWVYIITNKAMPDLVKVGFSTKDPIDRAKELSTGSPHPYIVEYEVCVENPQKVEKNAHAILKFINEGKEWFRCNIETAISAIRKSCESDIVIVERVLNSELTNKTNKKQTLKPPVTQLSLSIPPTKIKSQQLEKTADKPSDNHPNNADTNYKLGVQYDTGDNVKKSLKEGFRYFLLAAEQGYTLAELTVGKAYLIGRGVEKDLYQALIFLKKAADKENTEAEYLFGENTFFLDVAEASKFKKLKKEWCPKESSEYFAFSYICKSAAKNYAPAQYSQGIHFSLQNNNKSAFEMYEKSANNGYPLAQRYLADCYKDGIGCRRNLKLAKEWYQKAANGKDRIAIKRLEELD